jgi:hypothetical protein
LERGMAAEYREVWLVNIYAPSGAARQKSFFIVDLPYLLRVLPTNIPTTMFVGSPRKLG